MKTNPDQDRLVEDGGNPNCGIDRPTHPRPTLFTIVMLMIKTTLAGDLFDHFQMYLFNNCWIFIPRTPIIIQIIPNHHHRRHFSTIIIMWQGGAMLADKRCVSKKPEGETWGQHQFQCCISFNIYQFHRLVFKMGHLQPLVLSWGGSFLGLNLFEPRPSYNTLCKFIQRLNAWGKVNMKDVYLRIFRINSSEICEGCTYRRARVKCFFSKI